MMLCRSWLCWLHGCRVCLSRVTQRSVTHSARPEMSRYCFLSDRSLILGSFLRIISRCRPKDVLGLGHYAFSYVQFHCHDSDQLKTEVHLSIRPAFDLGVSPTPSRWFEEAGCILYLVLRTVLRGGAVGQLPGALTCWGGVKASLE